MAPPWVSPERFVGLDLHQTDVLVAAVDAQQQIVVPPRRSSFDEFDI
jgi:hypothetical protein